MPAPAFGDVRLIELSREVEIDYEKKARTIVMNNKKTGLVELESMSPGKSKQVLDKIDIELGKGYGLAAADVDLLVNLDIKYRMGQGMDDNDD